MEKRRQKEFLSTWGCVNNKKSSQQFPSCAIATRDSLFCKMFSPLFWFEHEKTLKNFSKKLYKCDKEKEKKQRRKEAFGTLAQIVGQSSGTRKLCVSVFFFFSGHSIKQIDSMLPWVCSVIDHRRKKRKWHTLLLLVCHFFVFTTFWRHLWTITEQTHSNMESC